MWSLSGIQLSKWDQVCLSWINSLAGWALVFCWWNQWFVIYHKKKERKLWMSVFIRHCSEREICQL